MGSKPLPSASDALKKRFGARPSVGEEKRASAASGGPHRAPARVFIADNRPLFHRRLAQALNCARGLRVCGQAEEPGEVLTAISRLRPDLVLVSLGRPVGIRLRLAVAIRAAHPRIKILVMAAQGEASQAARVLRAGADGYILEAEERAEVIQAIRDVLEGLIYVSERVVA